MPRVTCHSNLPAQIFVATPTLVNHRFAPATSNSRFPVRVSDVQSRRRANTRPRRRFSHLPSSVILSIISAVLETPLSPAYCKAFRRANFDLESIFGVTSIYCSFQYSPLTNPPFFTRILKVAPRCPLRRKGLTGSDRLSSSSLVPSPRLSPPRLPPSPPISSPIYQFS